MKRLENLNSKRVAVDFPQLIKSNVRWSMKKSDMNHLSNLLAGCSVCLNSGSTVSIDALVMEKLGGAKVAHSYQELTESILKYLITPELDAKKRQHALNMECHKNDGEATTRVVKAMLQMLEKEAVFHE